MLNDLTVETGRLTTDFGWHLVQTNAKQERLAKYHLDRQGFGTYLPMRHEVEAGERGARRPSLP